VDLAIPRGEVTGLLGTNGAGKSTLIRCLLGLLRPTGGTASLLGCTSWELADAEKSRLGYVAQEVQLFASFRVRDMVGYTAAFYSRWDANLVRELLERWELPESKSCGVLSAGERQKLGIVLALGHRPELLILDEPAASLDPQARRLFLESVLQLAADGERTILFSTHITSDIERAASHLAILQGGVVRLHSDLDGLKDRVKRLRITGGGGRLKAEDVPGVLKWSEQGEVVQATTDRYSPDLPQRLHEQRGVEVLVEDLNLEDVFLAFH
jgi:ABC-2 type transport system ATP-binding protein